VQVDSGRQAGRREQRQPAGRGASHQCAGDDSRGGRQHGAAPACREARELQRKIERELNSRD